jgi:glycosyltransferase involved in cell wall biosynthesis
MRILLVSDYGTASGGVERLVLRLRTALRDRGHDARLFTSTARAAAGPVLADATCYGTATALRTPLQAANPWARRALSRVLRAFRPDVVHVNIFLTQLSPSILSLLRNVPAVYHAHWYRPVCPKGTKRLPGGADCSDGWGLSCLTNRCLTLRAWLPLMVQRRRLRGGLHVFDRVIACGTPVRDRLREAGVDDVEVIWNGVAVTDVRPPLSGPPTVAYAGRFAPEKGVSVLVEAFARVLTRLPSARLLLAGDGPSVRHVEHMIATGGIADRVSRTGWLSDDQLQATLASAWVQAVPSLWREPFGLSAAEAMMRGTAVVGSAAGTLEELIEHERTGLLVPPGRADLLADALLRLLTARDEAERMGQAARRFALARLTESAFVDRMLGVYASVQPS